MPELPEVETIRRDLHRRLVGRTIGSVHVRRASVIEGPANRLSRALVGARVEDVGRHGKVLLIHLATGATLLVHLRMTGQLLVDPQTEPPFVRVKFRLSDGGALFYADCRALGRLELCPTRLLWRSRALANQGPDALSTEGARSLVAAARRRLTPIKNLLLDQSVMAGIGNIYASEILHAAHIAPSRPSNSLSAEELTRVRKSVRRVLNAAIGARGTTFSDFRDGIGRPGGYGPSLRVYQREGQPCRRRGCRGVIARQVQQQRSTYWCPTCQR